MENSLRFTGRKKYLDNFFDFFNNANKQMTILTYYGVGGIGKSSLKDEIAQKIKADHPKTLQIHIDFKNRGIDSLANALAIISSNLKQTYKDIDFPLFYFADEIYRAKISPYNTYNRNLNIKLLEGGDYTENVIKEIADQIKDTGKEFDLIPGVGLLTKTINFLSIGYKKLTDWRTFRGIDFIKRLPNMQPNDIENHLLELWSMDLRRYCLKKKVDAIFIVDTFEKYQYMAERYADIHGNYTWMEKLVKNFLEFEWLIFGRDPIIWIDTELKKASKTPQPIDHLLKEEVQALLDLYYIKNVEMQDCIFEVTNGIPLYVMLCIETYNKIGLKRTPTIEDFLNNKESVVKNFLNHLDKPDRETLKLLSVLRRWNTELANHLVKEHPTGISTISITELFQHSFITKAPLENMWYMHDLMKESLEEQLKQENEDLYKRINKTVFSYYMEKLKVAQSTQLPVNTELMYALIEGAYHGGKTENIVLTYLEFQPYNSYFINNGEFSAPIQVLEMFKAFIPNGIFSYMLLNDLGDFNIQIQDYEQAKKYLTDSIDKLSRENDDNSLSLLARGHQHMCTLYQKMNQLTDAFEEISKALNCYQRMEDQNNTANPKFASIVLDYLSIEMALGFPGEFHELKTLFKNAITVLDEDSAEIGRHYHNFGSFYASHGKTVDAISYYTKANNVGERLYPEHPDYAHHRLMLQHSMLLYPPTTEQIVEKEYIQSMGILEKFGIRNIYTVYGYYGLYNISLRKDNLPDAKKNLEECIALLEEINGDSSLLTECYYKLGLIYKNEPNTPQAEEYLRKTFRRIRSRKESLTPEYSIQIINDYLQLLNNLKKYRSMIPVYEQQYKQLRRVFSPNHQKVIDILKIILTLSNTYKDSNRVAKYKELYRKLTNES
ncbi:tetratricopeptide repeat protein [Neobacillus mesonae]|uniref:tetratricopeptide repeat protein n=1 Tax=Neobacillus mesonae TaxID=1193713 RepID=UPI00082B226B|nr:tetratricopeptide repeat protein [Neobacillus mesonae]